MHLVAHHDQIILRGRSLKYTREHFPSLQRLMRSPAWVPIIFAEGWSCLGVKLGIMVE